MFCWPAPQKAKTTFDANAPESQPGWLNAVIYEFILLHNASTDGVGHTITSASFDAPGNNDADMGIVTHHAVQRSKHFNQGPVFP